PTNVTSNVSPAVAENAATGTEVALFSSTDGDAGDTGTFSLLNSAGGLFSIAANGRLTTTQPLNFETTPVGGHTIRVRVTDNGGLTFDRDFAVAVTNVNEAPTSISANVTLSVPETSAASSPIAVFTAADPENNVTSYTLTDNAGGRFQIASNGQLSTGSTATDFETATINGSERGYYITVRATDAGGLTRDQQFWVRVTPVDEAPVMANTSMTYNVKEGANGGPGNQVSTDTGQAISITGTDPEAATLRYEIVGGNSMFSINSTTGALIQQGVTDYESSTKSYAFTVRAWDGGAVGVGNAATTAVTVQLVNVNEAPKVTAYLSAGTEAGGQPTVWHFGFAAVDPEGNAIVSATGATVGNSPVTPTVDSIYVVTIASILSMQPVITITLTDSLGAQATSTVQLLVGPPRGVVLGPVVLDLDGNGVDLVPGAASNVLFDMDGNGLQDPTGWVGAGDGFLALDRNGDGVITTGAEISFAQDAPDATSDLEGLAAYDTNENGYFDQGDARYGEFLVWQDANQDGVSQADELRSIADRGISAINLTRSMTGDTVEGATENVTVATSEYVRTDGSIGAVGDVSLAFRAVDVQVTILDESDPQAQSTQEQQAGRAAVGSRRRDADQRHAIEQVDETLEVQPPSIDEIDRSSNDPLPASLRPRGASDDRVDPKFRSAVEPRGREDEQATRNAAVADAEQQDPAARPQPRRLSAREPSSEDAAGAEPEFGPPQVAPSALHAGLDSITRRRLQMIEAMASFSVECAADLSLQPQRRVDAKTLELLTSVPTVKVA
ncbi:MAG: cadherin domain-containing protein, partial [Steroidobacteraceae bacterium]